MINNIEELKTALKARREAFKTRVQYIMSLNSIDAEIMMIDFDVQMYFSKMPTEEITEVQRLIKDHLYEGPR